MTTLSAKFFKNNANAGDPLQITIDMQTDTHNNILILERRVQQADGSYHTQPDEANQIFLGPIQAVSMQLTFPSPTTDGTYQYTTRVVDNDTGNTVLQDASVVNLTGISVAPPAKDTCDFFVDALLLPNTSTSVHVVFTASIQSNIVLEWNIRRIAVDGTIDTNPLRSTRYDFHDYYNSDVQWVVQVPDPPGQYEWEYRVLDGSANKQLSNKRVIVNVGSGYGANPVRKADVAPGAPARTVGNPPLPVDAVLMATIALLALVGLPLAFSLGRSN